MPNGHKYPIRIRYKGNIDVSYGRTKQGIRGDTNTFNVFSDFKIAWRHDQDQKANPNSRFSADVNLISRNYNKGIFVLIRTSNEGAKDIEYLPTENNQRVYHKKVATL